MTTLHLRVDWPVADTRPILKHALSANVPELLPRLQVALSDRYRLELQVGRQYQALFSLENATYMSIVGTNVTRAQKRHFDILPT